MKQDYSAELERLGREYAEGDPLALILAIEICRGAELPLPAWCYEPIEQLFDAAYFEAGPLAGKRSKRHWLNKTARDADRLRWDLVKRARAGDCPALFGPCVTIDDAFAAVGECLKCSANAVRDSYYRIEQSKPVPAK